MIKKIHIDTGLILRFQAGDLLAFDIIYKKYSRRIFNFAYFLLKSREDSENIVQEVFIKVWENRAKINHPDKFYSYIFSIAHNTIISLIREKWKDDNFKKQLYSLQEPFEDNIQADLELSEIQKLANNAMAMLTPRQREIYLLHREANCTYREIAAKLNISVNTVENHMAKALKILREQLNSSSLLIFLYIFLFL